MTIYKKKCWDIYFNAVKDGSKTFELRLSDEPYMKGDWLYLNEVDPVTNLPPPHTARQLRCIITYVLPFKIVSRTHPHVLFGSQFDEFWKPEQIQKYGLVILGIKHYECQSKIISDTATIRYYDTNEKKFMDGDYEVDPYSCNNCREMVFPNTERLETCPVCHEGKLEWMDLWR